MSRYSGKCDLYDFMSDRDDLFDADKIRDTKFFQNNELLEINTERQLALYFPFLIASAFFSARDSHVINISSNSYIRRREIELTDFYLRQICNEKKLCKRNNIEVTPERIYEKRFPYITGVDKEPLMKLINMTFGKGKKKYYEIRFDSFDYMRQEWYNVLISKYNYPRDFAYEWVMNK